MSDENGAERVWQIMDDINSCMLVTRDGGHIRARPMEPYVRRREHAVYFLTDVRQHKDEEVRHEPEVCLTFTHDGAYMSLSGRAAVSEDRGKISELWDSSAEAWFDGPDDPNVRLLTVRPEQAEYWDTPGKLARSVKMTAAALAGSRPDMGDNEKVRM